jgi:hypothetical protein
MTSPKSIVINGCEITVKLVKNIYRDYAHYGEYNSTEMTINIDIDMSVQKQELIFCHEVIEAIKDIYLLEDLKHDTIQPLAVAIYELIKKKQISFGEDTSA